MISDTIWNSIIVSDTNFQLNNLSPLTQYQLKLRSKCNDTSYSFYTELFPFTTNCDPIVNLPIVEDFESTNSGEIPTCYSILTSGNAQIFVVSYLLENTKTLHLEKYDQSELCFAILPKISAPISNKRIMLKYYPTSTSNIKIGYMTNISQSNSFVELFSCSLIANSLTNNWYHFDIPNIIALNGNERLAIQILNTTSNCYIDSIIICNSPTCEIPVNVNTSNITPISITLSCSQGAIGIAQSYNMRYKILGNSEWDSIMQISVPYSLNQLLEHTTYEFQLQTNCSNNDQSEWTTSYTFTTTCFPIFHLPWEENFNSYNSQMDIPPCWMKSDIFMTNISLLNYQNSSLGQHFFDNNDTFQPYVILPQFDNSVSLSNLLIEYDLFVEEGYSEIEVGFVTNPNDMSTFFPISSDTSHFKNRFHHIVVVSENYTGPARYIAFRTGDSESGNYIIDNIKISNLPQCIPPSNLFVTYNDNGNITLTWTENGNTTNWQIEYGPEGFAHGNGSIISTNTNPHIINNLTYGQTYDFYVRSVCQNETSDWSEKFSMIPGEIMFNKQIDSLITCNRILMSDGGISGPRFDHINDNIVLFPSTSGDLIKISGIFIPTNNNILTYNELHIHDGNSVLSPLVLTLTDSASIIPPIISTFGALTIEYNSNHTSYNAFFKLEIECVEGPECIRPINLQPIEIDSNSITLSWTDLSISTSYQIQYGSVGFTLGTGSSTFSTTNPAQINNLNSNTYYDFYVRSICNNSDTSAWSNKFTIGTTCNTPIDLPHFENFDSLNILPSCWTTFYSVDNFHIIQDGTHPVCTPHSGANMLYYNSYDIPRNNYVVLSSPPLNLIGFPVKVSYWYYRSEYGYNSPEGITIYVNSNRSLIGADSILFTPRSASTTHWEYITCTIPANLIGTYYILMKSYCDYGVNQYVDDINFEYVYPPCNPPTNFHATFIGTTTADLSWTPANNDTIWYIVYNSVNTNSDTTIKVTGNPTVHLTGLTHNHLYNFRIYAECYPDVYSYNSYTSFRTYEIICIRVSNVQILNDSITDHSAWVTWTPGGNEIGWILKYKRRYFPTWTETPVLYTNSYHITGLMSNYFYVVCVQAICPTNVSLVSPNYSFCTAGGDTYTIQAQANGPGTITPSGTITAYPGSSQTFQIDPDPGASISMINIDNIPLSDIDSTYTFTNILANHQISVDFILSINDFEQDQKIKIFPNPTSSVFNIQTDSDLIESKINSVSLYNMTGLKILEKNVDSNETQVDLSSYANGIYCCFITLNNTIIVKKIVLNK
jgi:hypothetical protein